MTLQTSGAISFTDLKNEYGGSSTNIKLGDYASKLENHGAGAHISYTIGWTGYHLTINGNTISDTGAVIDILFYAITHDTTITLLLDSSVTVPVYLRSTYGTDNSNLITTGVSNNGATYDASSAYHYGGYTQIHIADAGAALGNDGSEFGNGGVINNGIYIMTNQTQTNSASDSTVAYNVIQVDPSTNRNVVVKTPTVDLAFPSALSGGSEDSLVGGGTYFSLGSSSEPGLVRTGKSISMKCTCQAVSPAPANFNGPAVIAARIYGYPATLVDSNNHSHGASYGSPPTLGNIYWSTTVNPFTSWTSNSASGMASFYAANLSSSPASSSLTNSSWSASWSSSGGDLICTLTNNTGTDAYLIDIPHSNSSQYLPWILTWPGNDFQYYYTNTSNTCTNGQSQRYGQNLYSRFVHTLTAASGSTIGTYTFLGYHTSNANRAAVMADLLQLYNEYDGPGVNGADNRDEGINVGNGYGLFNRFFGIRASEPTTGTLRVHSRCGANAYYGGKIVTTYDNYHTANTFSGPTFGTTSAQGATNFTPTITYPDGVYDGHGSENARIRASNGDVDTVKYRMSMSEYYGGQG